MRIDQAQSLLLIVAYIHDGCPNLCVTIEQIWSLPLSLPSFRICSQSPPHSSARSTAQGRVPEGSPTIRKLPQNAVTSGWPTIGLEPANWTTLALI